MLCPQRKILNPREESLARWQSNPKIFWYGLILLLLFGSLAGGFVWRLQQSRQRVTGYFHLWEEDLGHSLVLEKNPALLMKIDRQLNELEPTVAGSKAILADISYGHSSGSCSFETRVPISLSTLPVGYVSICFSAQSLLAQTLVSPLFLLSLILGFGLAFIALVREDRKENALRLAQGLAGLSRQVAHDIRGPLMALKTLSQHGAELAPEKKALLSGAIQRIHSIAEDLLEKSRVAPSRQSVAPTKKIPFCLLQDSLQGLVPELQARVAPAELQLVIYEKSPLLIGLSRSELQRAISNLVQNSLEALPQKTEGRISILVHKKNMAAVIEVLDNGKGIEEKLIPQILQGQSLGKSRGHGLGLSDAKKRVENAGGELSISSRPGLGTRITLKLPLAADSHASSLLNHEA